MSKNILEHLDKRNQIINHCSHDETLQSCTYIFVVLNVEYHPILKKQRKQDDCWPQGSTLRTI